MQIWFRNILSLQICGIAICGLRHQGNLRICDLRIIHYKWADFRFPDRHTSEICRFAIAEWAQNLRISDLLNNIKIACPAWFSSVLPLIGIKPDRYVFVSGSFPPALKGQCHRMDIFWRYFLWRPWWFSMSFKSFTTLKYNMSFFEVIYCENAYLNPHCAAHGTFRYLCFAHFIIRSSELVSYFIGGNGILYLIFFNRKGYT